MMRSVSIPSHIFLSTTSRGETPQLSILTSQVASSMASRAPLFSSTSLDEIEVPTLVADYFLLVNKVPEVRFDTFVSSIFVL